jgi:hypothetical protein
MGLPIQRPQQGLRKSNVVSFTPGARATNATLQGWKEIALELGRSVRTVQRWEQKLGLPVHKLGDGVGSPVFAFKDELRSWLRVKADGGKKTEINASSKVESINQYEPPLGRRRNNSGSQAITSEPDIVKSLNAFFALKGANNNAPLCSYCQAPTRLLVGHFWLYGTEKTWQVSVPFCPNCDSDLRAMLPQAPVRLT